MKRLLIVIVAVILTVCSVFVYADESQPEHGEVLYHQDFADIGEFKNSGIKVGSLSSTAAEYGCRGEYFTVATKDNGRVYMILPEVYHSSTYTVEFSMKFTDTTNAVGYIAFMLTCRGEEPTNISSLVFRADGTIDDFSEIPKELSEAIAAGEDVEVIIPVENDILYRIIVTVGDNAYTLERDSMLVISDGGMGFMYRHIGASVREVYIVNGVGYTEKIGDYADNSFATDDCPVITPDGNGNCNAPATSDLGFAVSAVVMTVSGAAILAISIDSIKKRRRG
ncbi:MAG: hypothetical protein J6L96_00930 [Clostridia bacterium]|nr:hypothetical protein [Clostridia bacterium]